MNSDLPKVLHKVAAAPLLHHALSAGATLSPSRIVVVTGHGAEAVARAADGLGISPAQVAYLWVRDAPGVTAPLLGVRTPAQLAPYLDAEDMALPTEIARALDDVSGGPNEARDAA